MLLSPHFQSAKDYNKLISAFGEVVSRPFGITPLRDHLFDQAFPFEFLKAECKRTGVDPECLLQIGKAPRLD